MKDIYAIYKNSIDAERAKAKMILLNQSLYLSSLGMAASNLISFQVITPEEENGVKELIEQTGGEIHEGDNFSY